ncbi:hypothetical protein [Streptomyces sp. A475]|uniref:hypothetical protein n=1 Tax=Streptomyces sp. A475 TaxID=3131976 RepID=UPI0030EC48B4
MTHTVHTPVSVGLADLDLLAAVRRRVRQLVGLLETLPFAEYTAGIARECVDGSGPLQEAFERFIQLDRAGQLRQLRVWQGAMS